jgi:hypothetical protein
MTYKTLPKTPKTPKELLASSRKTRPVKASSALERCVHNSVKDAEQEDREFLERFDARRLPYTKRPYVRQASYDRLLKTDVRQATIERLTGLTGIPGHVWGEEIIAEETAIMMKEAARAKAAPRRILTVELHGMDSELLILGLEILLKRARSKGVDAFKFGEPEEIEGVLSSYDESGVKSGETPVTVGYALLHAPSYQQIRQKALEFLRNGGVKKERLQPSIDFASLLAEKDVYDPARVQPPKGGKFIRGSRFVQQTGIILDTDGRKKRIFIRAGTSIPVEADGTQRPEVLRLYAEIHRLSDGKFVRAADSREIAIAFPKFVFLLPFVGTHIQGIKEIEDFIPLCPSDEELRQAGINPATYGL